MMVCFELISIVDLWLQCRATPRILYNAVVNYRNPYSRGALQSSKVVLHTGEDSLNQPVKKVRGLVCVSSTFLLVYNFSLG